jgi:hypothetical protein
MYHKKDYFINKDKTVIVLTTGKIRVRVKLYDHYTGIARFYYCKILKGTNNLGNHLDRSHMKGIYEIAPVDLHSKYWTKISKEMVELLYV